MARTTPFDHAARRADCGHRRSHRCRSGPGADRRARGAVGSCCISDFEVLSVRVVGPLYGRESRNGYDPAPDTKLSYSAFRAFLGPYHFKFGPTPWDLRFITYSA